MPEENATKSLPSPSFAFFPNLIISISESLSFSLARAFSITLSFFHFSSLSLSLSCSLCFSFARSLMLVVSPLFPWLCVSASPIASLLLFPSPPLPLPPFLSLFLLLLLYLAIWNFSFFSLSLVQSSPFRCPFPFCFLILICIVSLLHFSLCSCCRVPFPAYYDYDSAKSAHSRIHNARRKLTTPRANPQAILRIWAIHGPF